MGHFCPGVDNTNRPTKFVRGCAVLGVREEPDRGKPLGKRNRGESSKIIPILAVNCRLHSLQRQSLRVLMNCTSALPQPLRGQAIPFGQRSLTA